MLTILILLLMSNVNQHHELHVLHTEVSGVHQEFLEVLAVNGKQIYGHLIDLRLDVARLQEEHK